MYPVRGFNGERGTYARTCVVGNLAARRETRSASAYATSLPGCTLGLHLPAKHFVGTVSRSQTRGLCVSSYKTNRLINNNEVTTKNISLQRGGTLQEVLLLFPENMQRWKYFPLPEEEESNLLAMQRFLVEVAQYKSHVSN